MRIISFAFGLLVFQLFFPMIAKAIVQVVLSILEIIQTGLDLMQSGNGWY